MKKILGMGNALTDILLQISDDAVLEKLNLPKGGMQLIDTEKLSKIRDEFDFSVAKMVTGGSASNTVNGISRLGGKAGFFGKVGRDEVGDFFEKDTMQSGVIPHLSYSKQKSGTCTVLVSKDGERTLCTFLGAACEFDVADLRREMFRNYDIFHIEGYLVQNHALIEAAIIMAREEGLIVSIDLASYNVVEENLNFLKSIVSKYVDIVFANEDEARAFTGKEPKEALIKIAEEAYIAVVKIGKNGSYVRSVDTSHVIKPYQADCIDTTGAGDLYAAGFLYGVALGLTLDKCGQVGSLVSSQVVEVLGAKMSDATWDDINNKVKLIQSEK